MRTSRILLVDDDRNFLRVLTYHIEQLGFHAVPVPSGREAIRRVKEEPIDLVVTDLKMPEMGGLQLLEEIRRFNRDLPVVVLTAYGSIDKAVEAVKKGAFDFLSKPFEKEEIQHTVANALKMVDLLEENRRLAREVHEKFKFEGIIGSSRKFRELLGLAEQLAEVDTTVLIQGESGTGKEILAHAIHFNSRRRNKPFVVVNCGAIPKDLVESELFGYRKGAFTGAVSNKKGKFEIADSGTLFLDEIGELPAGTQVKLLRALQEKEIDIVGDPRPQPVDVRIVAATNKDLKEKMLEGAFREDLFYRLSVAPLYVPPLRERLEDIPLLVHHFLKIFTERFDKDVTIEPSAVEALQRYDWPGNVRELENVIERVVVFDRNGVVTEKDLPLPLGRHRRTLGKVIVQMPEESFSLQELEKEMLLAALEKYDWNQTHAAQYLGLTRNTLIYRMQKFDLKPGHKEASKT